MTAPLNPEHTTRLTEALFQLISRHIDVPEETLRKEYSFYQSQIRKAFPASFDGIDVRTAYPLFKMIDDLDPQVSTGNPNAKWANMPQSLREARDILDRICRSQYLPPEDLERFGKQFNDALDTTGEAAIYENTMPPQTALALSALFVKTHETFAQLKEARELKAFYAEWKAERRAENAEQAAADELLSLEDRVKKAELAMLEQAKIHVAEQKELDAVRSTGGYTEPEDTIPEHLRILRGMCYVFDLKDPRAIRRKRIREFGDRSVIFDEEARGLSHAHPEWAFYLPDFRKQVLPGLISNLDSLRSAYKDFAKIACDSPPYHYATWGAGDGPYIRNVAEERASHERSWDNKIRDNLILADQFESALCALESIDSARNPLSYQVAALMRMGNILEAVNHECGHISNAAAWEGNDIPVFYGKEAGDKMKKYSTWLEETMLPLFQSQLAEQRRLDQVRLDYEKVSEAELTGNHEAMQSKQSPSTIPEPTQIVSPPILPIVNISLAPPLPPVVGGHTQVTEADKPAAISISEEIPKTGPNRSQVDFGAKVESVVQKIDSQHGKPKKNNTAYNKILAWVLALSGLGGAGWVINRAAMGPEQLTPSMPTSTASAPVESAPIPLQSPPQPKPEPAPTEVSPVPVLSPSAQPAPVPPSPRKPSPANQPRTQTPSECGPGNPANIDPFIGPSIPNISDALSESSYDRIALVNPTIMGIILSGDRCVDRAILNDGVDANIDIGTGFIYFHAKDEAKVRRSLRSVPNERTVTRIGR